MGARRRGLIRVGKVAGPLALLAGAFTSPGCGGLERDAEAASERQPTASAIANGERASSVGERSPVEILLAALSETTDRVAHEDVAGLVAVAKFARNSCASDSNNQDACPAGMAPVNTAPEFPYVACDAHYAAEGELEGIFKNVFRGRAPQLFAIARTEPSAAEGPFPLGPYAAVFETTPPFGVTGSTGAILALDESGRILSLRTGCRATPFELYESLPVRDVLIERQR